MVKGSITLHSQAAQPGAEMGVMIQIGLSLFRKQVGTIATPLPPGSAVRPSSLGPLLSDRHGISNAFENRCKCGICRLKVACISIRKQCIDSDRI